MPEGWLRSPGARSFSLKERLEEKAAWDGDCWVWRKAGSNGRGYLWVEGRPEVAARVAYSVFKGVVTRKEEVAVTCGNSRCIAPDHLVKRPIKTSLKRGGTAGRKWKIRPSDVSWEAQLVERYSDRLAAKEKEKRRLANLTWEDIIVSANLIGPLPINLQQVAFGASIKTGVVIGSGPVRRGPPHAGRRSVKSRPPRAFYFSGHRKARCQDGAT